MGLIFSAFVLFLLINFVVYRRVSSLFLANKDGSPLKTWQKVARAALAIFLLASCSVLLVYRSIHLASGDVSGPLTLVTYIWLGVISIFLPLWIVVEFGWLVARIIQKIRKKTGFSQNVRLWIAREVYVVLIAVTLALSGLAIEGGLRAPVIQRVPIQIGFGQNKPLRIVQLTDVHLSVLNGAPLFEEIVARVNSLEPDLVVITGDLVDGSVSSLADAAAPILKLKSKLGTYFVLGNHEYYSGSESWISHLDAMGIHILRNDSVTLSHNGEPFELIGVDDWAGGRRTGHFSDLKKAMANHQAGVPTILLSHQPQIVDEAAEAGIDVVLAGHTHAGQFWPWSIVVGLVMPYVQGLHHHLDRTWIYVSAGTMGWGPPFRLGSEREITLVELGSTVK